MKKFAILILLLAAPCFADPPSIDIPAEVKPNGQYCRVSPKTDAVSVLYVGLDGIEPVPSDLLRDGRLFLLDTRGLAAGRYRFAAVGASKTGEEARTDFVVIIGTPPNPPGPTPPAPDALAAALQAAYTAEASTTKAGDVAKLASLYKLAAGSLVNDSSVSTWGDLITGTHAAIAALFATSSSPDAVLQGVRKVIADDLQSLGKDPTAAIDRVKAAAEYTKISQILGGLK